MRRMQFIVLAVTMTVILLSGVGWADVKVNQSSRHFNETTIAVDPTDANQVVAVAQQSVTPFRSTDGGATWTESSVLKREDCETGGRSWDPWNAANRVDATTATFDIAYISSCDGLAEAIAQMRTSSDGGLSWSAPTTVSPPDGYADRVHISGRKMTPSRPTYASYTFVGAGTIRVWSSLRERSVGVGAGLGSATIAAPASTPYPISWTAWGSFALPAIRLRSVEWRPFNDVLGLTYTIGLIDAPTAMNCQGNIGPVAPGTKIRHGVYPILAADEVLERVYVVYNTYESEQFKLVVKYFDNPAQLPNLPIVVHSFPGKNVLFPNADYDHVNQQLVATFYLQEQLDP